MRCLKPGGSTARCGCIPADNAIALQIGNGNVCELRRTVGMDAVLEVGRQRRLKVRRLEVRLRA